MAEDTKNEGSEESSTTEEQEENEEEAGTGEEEEASGEEDAENEEGDESDTGDDAGLVARVRQLEVEKQQLNTLLQRMMEQSKPATASEDDETEETGDDEVDPAVQRRLNKVMKKERQAVANMVGSLYDRMDELDMKGSSNAPLYQKFQSQVEELRQQESRQGRYLKREEALAFILARKGYRGEPTGKKKPAPKKVIKQKVKPAGEIKQGSRGANSGAEKPLDEKLKGVTF